MLGISNSIFNEAGGLVKDWLKNPLNASFFYWYFLPALGLVLLQAFFIWPLRGYPAPTILSSEVGHSSNFVELLLQVLNTSVLGMIMVPLVIAVLLSALTGATFRLYQGNLALVRPVFRAALMRNRKRSIDLYSQLAQKRRAYFFLVSRGVNLKSVDGNEIAAQVSDDEREKLIETLKAEIQALHEQFEQTPNARKLPIDPDRVGATNLANTLAVAEEYPFERYSVDTAVFWPRLSSEMDAEKLKGLTATFGTMNGLLNLSLLSYVFGIECIVLAIGFFGGWFNRGTSLIHPAWLTLAVLVAAVGGVAFYRAAVRAAGSVGNELQTAFDYYRGQVLRRFNLRMPKDIEEERVLWLKLAAFIRRGESFYYPSDYRID